MKKIKSDVERENRTNIQQRSEDFFETVSPSLRGAMELSQEKGSSSWLNVNTPERNELRSEQKRIP